MNQLSAKPIWSKNQENTQMNLSLAFKAVIGKGQTLLRITASNAYQLFINGHFAAAGPARACHGYFKLDERELTSLLTEPENSIVILVAAYNTYNFEYADQPGFLLAEIEQNGEIVCATGNRGFTCREWTERVQRVDRYSFQRTFAEVYRLSPKTMEWLESTDQTATEPMVTLPPVKLLKRGVYDPAYESAYPKNVVAEGKATLDREGKDLSLRVYMGETPTVKTYGFNLDDRLCADIEDMTFEKTEVCLPATESFTLSDARYQTLSFERIASGYISFEVNAAQDSIVYLIFDEVLTGGDINPRRLSCVNGIKLYFTPGYCRFFSFEPYTMKFLKLVVLSGSCTFKNLQIKEVSFPKDKIIYHPDLKDEVLKQIYDAAIQSFRQNVVDIYMDCPSRERAGWLCDSFFTSRVERLLTGKSVVEREFLQNFVLPENFSFIPQGMLPMCYPSDHPDKNFIPNWAMWFVLEMEEYLKRTGDTEMAEAAKNRLYALLDYFKRYENEFELLEKLDGWIFIEWSRANDKDVVQDVNYPTNMTYAAVLKAMGGMYHDRALLDKADRINKVIREQSYNGSFFVDNAYRRENGLVPSGITTEVCQYYAFFFRIAEPEQYKELWEKLVKDFGPWRKQHNSYPDIFFANAFIGNYLRLELLMRYGQQEQALDNIKGYFYKMAQLTGTLWEHDDVSVGWLSYCHGFASHVLVWLDQLKKSGKI